MYPALSNTRYDFSTTINTPSVYFIQNLPFVILVGTGGNLTTDIVQVEEGTGSEELIYKVNAPEYSNTKLTINVDEINAIKSYLGLNNSEIAKILQVQRQTIYDWLHGSMPRSSNLERLYQLCEIADYWHSINAQSVNRYLHKPVVNDQSLFRLLLADPLDITVIYKALNQISEVIAKNTNVSEYKLKLERQAGFKELSKKEQLANISQVVSIVADKNKD